MIFPARKNVDAYWRRICESGLRAKVSTIGGNAGAYGDHVICMYANLNEKELVRDKLREIGFTGDLPWKMDVATLGGDYSLRTHQLVEQGRLIRKVRPRK